MIVVLEDIAGSRGVPSTFIRAVLLPRLLLLRWQLMVLLVVLVLLIELFFAVTHLNVSNSFLLLLVNLRLQRKLVLPAADAATKLG